jgi:hypothetical protein
MSTSPSRSTARIDRALLPARSDADLLGPLRHGDQHAVSADRRQEERDRPEAGDKSTGDFG